LLLIQTLADVFDAGGTVEIGLGVVKGVVDVIFFFVLGDDDSSLDSIFILNPSRMSVV
jgi:hypothetical protein